MHQLTLEFTTAPNISSASTPSRTSPEYWYPKLRKRTFKGKAGLKQIPDWQVRIQFNKVERWHNLRTSDRNEAARRAAIIYKGLCGAHREPPGTLGEYIRTLESLKDLSKGTIYSYSSKLRTLAAELCHVDSGRKHDRLKGAKEWRAKVEAISISCFTDKKIKAWVTASLEAGKTREGLERILSIAGTAFAKGITKRLPPGTFIPEADWSKLRLYAMYGESADGRPSNQTRGFVYLGKRQADGAHKIGWSRALQQRKRTLHVYYKGFQMIGYREGTQQRERELHAQYASFRVTGEKEFFAFPPEVLKRVEKFFGVATAAG